MPATSSLSLRNSALKWCFGVYAVFSLISMATMSISAALLIAAILFYFQNFQNLKLGFLQEWENRSFRLYFLVSVFLTISCILSLISGIFFPLSFAGKYSQIHFFKDMSKAWYLFWPILLVMGLRKLTLSDRTWVIKVWLGTFTLLSAIGVAQFFTGWPRSQLIPGETMHHHATLFLGHHLSVASILIFPFFVCLDYCARFRNEYKSTNFYHPLMGAILGGITLFFTYSRTLWVALPVGLFVWMLLILPKKWKFISTVLLALGIFALSQYPPIQNRFQDKLGIATRQELWKAHLDFLKNRPLFGVGWRHNQELSGYYLMEKYQSNSVFSGHAHNNFLDMLGGIGATGASAWLLWCMIIFWILLKNKSSETPIDFRRGLICAWIVFQINGLTQLNFWEAKVEHQMAWVIAWSLL